jgi:hypothetical protein
MYFFVCIMRIKSHQAKINKKNHSLGQQRGSTN